MRGAPVGGPVGRDRHVLGGGRPRIRAPRTGRRPGVSLAVVGGWRPGRPSATLWANHGDENSSERCRMSWHGVRLLMGSSKRSTLRRRRAWPVFTLVGLAVLYGQLAHDLFGMRKDVVSRGLAEGPEEGHVSPRGAGSEPVLEGADYSDTYRARAEALGREWTVDFLEAVKSGDQARYLTVLLELDRLGRDVVGAFGARLAAEPLPEAANHETVGAAIRALLTGYSLESQRLGIKAFADGHFALSYGLLRGNELDAAVCCLVAETLGGRGRLTPLALRVLIEIGYAVEEVEDLVAQSFASWTWSEREAVLGVLTARGGVTPGIVKGILALPVDAALSETAALALGQGLSQGIVLAGSIAPRFRSGAGDAEALEEAVRGLLRGGAPCGRFLWEQVASGQLEVEHLAAAIERITEPLPLDVVVRMARRFMAHGDYFRAASMAERAIRQDPSFGPAVDVLCEILRVDDADALGHLTAQLDTVGAAANLHGCVRAALFDVLTGTSHAPVAAQAALVLAPHSRQVPGFVREVARLLQAARGGVRSDLLSALRHMGEFSSENLLAIEAVVPLDPGGQDEDVVMLHARVRAAEAFAYMDAVLAKYDSLSRAQLRALGEMVGDVGRAVALLGWAVAVAGSQAELLEIARSLRLQGAPCAVRGACWARMVELSRVQGEQIEWRQILRGLIQSRCKLPDVLAACEGALVDEWLEFQTYHEILQARRM